MSENPRSPGSAGDGMTDEEMTGAVPLPMPEVDPVPDIKFVAGDIFLSGCEALVNPTNVSPGLMGALAGFFARRFPGLESNYLEAVRAGKIAPGVLHPFVPGVSSVPTPKVSLIINFPTTPTLGASSTMDYIESGLANLTPMLQEYNIKSVAIPAIGAGFGGIDYQDVKAALLRWHTKECPADVWVVCFTPL